MGKLPRLATEVPLHRLLQVVRRGMSRHPTGREQDHGRFGSRCPRRVGEYDQEEKGIKEMEERLPTFGDYPLFSHRLHGQHLEAILRVLCDHQLVKGVIASRMVTYGGI